MVGVVAADADDLGVFALLGRKLTGVVDGRGRDTLRQFCRMEERVRDIVDAGVVLC